MRLPISLFRRTARHQSVVSRRVPSFRLRVEALEGRDCPSGLLDPTFGTDGVVNLPSATDNGASAVAAQPDGRVVVVGRVSTSKGGEVISVQRLNQDGSLDTTFNKSGSLTIQAGRSDFPNAVALQPDGKILIGGGASANNGTLESLVARVNPNGTLDTKFGNSRGLELLTNVGQVQSLAVLTDPAHPSTVIGIIAAAEGSFKCYKLTPGGLPDMTFGVGGFVTLSNLTGGLFQSVAVAPSGEIYLAGYVHLASMTNTEGCLAAVSPAGVPDLAFGGGTGYVLVDPTGSQESEFYSVAVQTIEVNGQSISRIVTGGYELDAAGYDTGLVTAYTLDGALDTAFGTAGSFTFSNPAGEYSYFKSLALEADGSIVLAGTQSYTGTDGYFHQEMLVGHLTAAGTADSSFGSDGTGFTVLQDGLNSEAWGLAIDPTDGNILVSGYSSNPHTARQAVVARFTGPA